MLQWISSFLGDCTQSVIVDGVCSHTGSSIDGDDFVSGVPQGTVMTCWRRSSDTWLVAPPGLMVLSR